MSSSPVLAALNDEWSRLRTTRPVGSTGVRWSTVSDSLDVLEVGQLVDALAARPDPQVADAILWPLLFLAGDGDELAGRTVLQATLGLAARLSRQARTRGLEDPHEVALGALWSAIRAFPLHRRHRIAANLAGEAMKALPRADHRTIVVPDPREDWETSPEHEAPATEEVAALLVWARTHRILASEDLSLMTAVYLREVSPTVAGRHLGLSAPAVRKRLSRATRVLTTQVRERLACPSPEDVVQQVALQLGSASK